MPPRWLFLLIYGCSGFAGLVYEVAWTRLLGLEIGHGGQAAATVLGAYMGGMAVGALAAGRLAPAWTPRGALRAYAWLEAVIALYALVLPWALVAARPLLAAVYGQDGGGAAFRLTRLAVCLALLSVPTAAMGAAFPVAARGFLRRPDRAGADLGGLYAANTAGAALGALGAGFVLLPALGLQATTAVAAAASASAAGAAWWLSRRGSEVKGLGDAPTPVAPPVLAPTRSARRPGSGPARGRVRPPIVAPAGHVAIAAVALGLSGAAALAAELAWSRVLALVVGPTSYAFGAMLATFIAGLALGSTVGTAIARVARRPALWLAVALAAAGASTVGVGPLVNRLPIEIAEAASSAGSSGLFIVRPFITALAWILPMAAAFGAAFPLGLALATGTLDRAPRVAATLLAANTVGAVAGALGGGFVLLSSVGLERTFDVIAVVAAIGAVVAAGAATPRRLRLAAAVIAVVPLIVAWAGPRWDLDLILGGAYKYGRYLAGVDPESALRAGTLLYHADGRAGVVSVRRTAGVLALAIDGKVDASNGGDMLTQKLLGHLPLLLHPAPRRVSVIGLGSGVTLGAVLRHPVGEVDVLELSPEVVRASEFFVAEHHGALQDPRTRLIVGDGRTHLLLSRRYYDVIISEPSNPWISGMSALFTREFFAAARDRLAPGGLMCQWAHTYDMAEADLRSIVATFASVFPGATLWLVGEGDLLLIGGRSTLAVRPADIAARWEGRPIAPDMASARVTRPSSILSLLAAEGDDLARYAAGARLQTDDTLALEYSAPRAIFRASRADIAGALNRLAGPGRPTGVTVAIGGPATADDWIDRGRMMLGAEAPRLAYTSFERALALAPRDDGAIGGLVEAAPAAGETAAAIGLLGDVIGRAPDNLQARVGYSRLLAADGRFEEAEREARLAAERFPDAPVAIEQWAALLSDTQQVDQLSVVADRLMRQHPERPDAAYYAGTLMFLQGRFDEAAVWARRATGADPRHSRAWGLAGAALASAGRTDEARQAFEAAVAADPREPSVYANLGLMALNLGRPDEAARHFAEALAADAGYRPARDGLATALDRLGAPDRARRVRAGS